MAGLEPLSLAVISMSPLVTWYVLDNQLTVTTHADHDATGWTVAGVTGQDAGVTTAVWAGVLTRFLTLLTRVTCLATMDVICH